MKIKFRNLMIDNYELTDHFRCLSYAASAEVAIVFHTQEEEWSECGRLFDYFGDLLFRIEEELTIKNDCSPSALSFGMPLPDQLHEIHFQWVEKDRYKVINEDGIILGNIESQEIINAVFDFISKGLIAFSCGSTETQLSIIDVICPESLSGMLANNLKNVQVTYQPEQPAQMRKIDGGRTEVGWILYPKED